MNKEEKIQILKMIESKQISPDEGMKLLEAVEENELIEAPQAASSKEAEWVKIRVSDGVNTAVNVNLPLALLEVAINIGKKFIPLDNEQLKDIDFAQIIKLIQHGANGKLVEVQDGDTSVEIIVE